MSTDIVYAESNISKEAAAIFQTSGYDSGWKAVNNYSNQNVYFTHGLGKTPSRLTVMFSPDQQHSYPLQWSWNPENSGNPVTIWCNNTSIACSVVASQPLHGWWDGDKNSWIYWKTGYFRVFAE